MVSRVAPSRTLMMAVIFGERDAREGLLGAS